MDMSIVLEDTGELLTLRLHPDDHARAQNDVDFLRSLVESSRQQENIEHVEEQQHQDQGDADDTSPFIWKNEVILLLLSLYEEVKEDFDNKKHKGLWNNIAKKINDTGHCVTGGQCQSKINGLKRTFKKIIDHNKTSGNNRVTWPFYDRMMELFGRDRWVQPIAVASEVLETESSSSSEVTPIKKKKKFSMEAKENARHQQKKEKELKQQRFTEFLALKERHHKEKMDLLASLVNKKN